MNYIMHKDKVISTVYRVCQENQIQIHHELSKTTNSVYFWIEYNAAHFEFRISDHTSRFCSERNIRSLVIRNRTKMSLVESFVKNRIKAIKDISLKLTFARLSGGLAPAAA